VIEPVENLSGMDRMMQVMALVGQSSGPAYSMPLGASLNTTTTTSDTSASAPSFQAMYSLARADGTFNASDTGAVPSDSTPVSSQLDWSGPADQLPAGTPYAADFEAAGKRYGISPKLLAAQADVESGFRTDAVSSAGAQGIMQFMPATAKGRGVDPSNPASAIDGAARYLRDLIGRFGSVDVALAAYNVGAGTVAQAGGTVPAGARNYVDQILKRANGRAS
jgi:soluble lytic murein transglycosylase-like protein